MSKAVLLVLFLAVAITSIVANKKIVCYYGSWATYRPGDGKFDPEDINPALCTHLIYTFVGIATDGNVQILDSWMDLPDGKNGFGRFTRLRELNPDAKALIAIGGWNEGSEKYSQVAAKPEIRARFVQNVVDFLKKYNFDGFDVDWEYPNQRGGNPSDIGNFTLLLKELKEAFKSHGYILSVAAVGAQSSASKSYHIRDVSENVDFINLMTYDYHGSWETHTGNNAPLYASSNENEEQATFNVNASVHYWLSEGAAPEKLILGVPFYGRSFTLANPANNGVGAPTSGAGNGGPLTGATGMLGYNEICLKLREGWTSVRDDQQRVPYAFSGNQWVGYDDQVSIDEKARYVLDNGLGGIMLWSIETDDFRGACGEKYPLLKTINRILIGKVPDDLVNSTTPIPAPKPTPPSSICADNREYVRDPKDCSTFYHCVKDSNGGRHPIEFHCHDGLVFDPSTNTCNFKEHVPGC